jgi:hypothetical protein
MIATKQNDKCVCGSGRKFKKCCSEEKAGKRTGGGKMVKFRCRKCKNYQSARSDSRCVDLKLCSRCVSVRGL